MMSLIMLSGLMENRDIQNKKAILNIVSSYNYKVITTYFY